MNTATQTPDVIKGYKVTDSEMKCRGYQFSLNEVHTHEGKVKACDSGFHFCYEANNCFNYNHAFDPKNRVFEVEGWGDADTSEGDKVAVRHIKFVRELTWHEVLTLVNTGTGNTGRGNAGNYNAGNDNAGYRNAGNYNAGNYNAGNYNAGNRNAGNRNAGNDNAGNRNAGNYNAGNDNAGYSNAGYRNAGNYNAGNRNAGNYNAGNYNAGNYNAGNRNAGDSNAGNDNAGNFNTDGAPYIMFNKPCDWKFEDFQRSDAFRLLHTISTTMWVPSYAMTDEEKEKHPYHVTTQGYVRHIPFNEAFPNAWHNWNAENRRAFTSLPNFDAQIFEEITGVKISTDAKDN